jgi:hypothetical protein
VASDYLNFQLWSKPRISRELRNVFSSSASIANLVPDGGKGDALEQESGGRKLRVFAKHNRLEQRSQSLAGSVQSRLDGSRVDAQMRGRLFGIEFLDVAEQEYLSVRIGQTFDAGPDVGAGLGLG